MLKMDDYEEWSQTYSDDGSFSVIPGSMSVTLEGLWVCSMPRESQGQKKYICWVSSEWTSLVGVQGLLTA